MKSTPDDTPIDDALQAGLAAMGLNCSALTRTRLCDYLRLLSQWNTAYNLTAVEHIADMVPRHVLDSLSVAAHLDKQRFIDIGTGAGLPGIPLALWFPQREFHLLDSNGKKMRFLFEVKHRLALCNVTLHHCRAENFSDTAGFDCILSRAFASLAHLLATAAHLLAADGCFIAMKGELDDSELAGLPSHYTVVKRVQLSVPGILAPRQLLRIERASITAGKMTPL